MQLFYAPDIVPPEYTLSEEESKHCIRVLRMACGEELHITDGRKATCYPGLEEKMGAAVMTACGAVQDGRVITGRAAGSADECGLLCLQALKGKAAADQVAADIVYRA